MKKPSCQVEIIKRTILAAINRGGDNVETTEKAVAEILTQAIKEERLTGPPLINQIMQIAGGAIQGAMQAGADLGNTAKGTLLGVLRGTGRTGDEALEMIRHTAESTIRNAAEVGGDLGSAAGGLIDGAVTGAKESGISTKEAAAASARGILQAAEQVGPMTLEIVRIVLTRPINGITVLSPEAGEAVPASAH